HSSDHIRALAMAQSGFTRRHGDEKGRARVWGSCPGARALYLASRLRPAGRPVRDMLPRAQPPAGRARLLRRVGERARAGVDQRALSEGCTLPARFESTAMIED